MIGRSLVCLLNMSRDVKNLSLRFRQTGLYKYSGCCQGDLDCCFRIYVKIQFFHDSALMLSSFGNDKYLQ